MSKPLLTLVSPLNRRTRSDTDKSSARKNNVRLIVKSSGHDFLGRSVAPGSLSIWVHHMNNVEYHEGSFQLTDSDTVIDGDAITCGGGTDMYTLYETTDEHGTVVVGGGGKSVSVGGYLSGGGHGLLSPEFGLAVDNVLEIEVVTPKGDILVVNEDNHADLFWALRGVSSFDIESLRDD